MGILFNLIVIYPLRRVFNRLNANWQQRKDAGEKVFPLKPDTVFILSGGIPIVLVILYNALFG